MRVTVEVAPVTPRPGSPVVVGVVVLVPTGDVMEAIDLATPAAASVQHDLAAAGFSSSNVHVTVHREPRWVGDV